MVHTIAAGLVFVLMVLAPCAIARFSDEEPEQGDPVGERVI